MDTAQIFAIRLKNARQMKNMSMAELSSALGEIITPQAIYKYEAGKMLPSSKVIIALSRVFNVSIDYFFRPLKTSITNIEFRKKAKLGAKERKNIGLRATEFMERFFEISDICNCSLPPFMVPEGPIAQKEDIVRVAALLRKKWNITDGGINNVIHFLEGIGVIVIEIDASLDFDGFSGMAGQAPVIVLNKAYKPERKRFTAMHELGHLCLSFDPTLSEKEIENLCHLFAGEMLISSNLLKTKLGDIRDKKISLQELAELQMTYGISIDALMHKAKDFELIGEPKYKNYNIMKNTKNTFRNYVDKSRYKDEHTDRFDKMVYRAYADNLITSSKAANLLGISVNEMIDNAMFV